jgi:hypothetical protein
MQPHVEDLDATQKDGHWQNYADYSRTLRAWLVAYGVGAPVLFLTNDKVSTKVAVSGHAREIIFAFLFGVALQIVLALINKWGAWHMYVGAGDHVYQARFRYCLWGFINKQSWLDFVMDVTSIAAFVWATWRVFNIFLALPAAA